MNWFTLRILLLTLCFATTGFAQNSFYKHYSSSQYLSGLLINSVGVTTSTTEYYFTGLNGLFVTGTDGTIHWTRQFTENTKNILPVTVKNTSDSGYILGGYYYDDFSTVYNFLIKLDSLGNTVWAKNFDFNNRSSTIQKVVETSDGGYAMCAIGGGDTNMVNGTWVAKTDHWGNLLWTKIILDPTAVLLSGSSIENTSDGGLVVASKQTDMNNDRYTALSRLDAQGNLLWTQSFSGASINEWPYATQCTDGGFAVVGVGFIAGNYELSRLIRTDSLGNLLWVKQYGTKQTTEFLTRISQTSDGGFILGGESLDYIAGITSPYIIKTDANGDTLWSRVMRTNAACGGTANSVCETPDGGYLLSEGSVNFIKTDPNGYIACIGQPIHTLVFDTLVPQHYSNAYTIGGTMLPTTITNTILPVTDSTFCTGVFEAVGIASPQNEFTCTLYPNPTQGVFKLEQNFEGSEVNLEIYNAIGTRMLVRKNLTSDTSIDLSQCAAGIYFVRIEMDGKAQVIRLIKE